MGDTTKNNQPNLATPEIDETDDDRLSGDGKSNTPIRENPVIVPNNGLIPQNAGTSTVKPSVQGQETVLSHRRPSVTFPHLPNESDSDSDHHHHHHHHDAVSTTGTVEEIPDLNVYQHKKTLAQGMMDLALFSANANQLRYVLDSYDRHPYYYPSLLFICFSMFLQVAIGVLLIWNATYNVKDEKEVCRANKINNYTVIGIFLVTVVNVFVSAFGVADPPETQLFTRSANSTS